MEACSNSERAPSENAVTEMKNPIASLGARHSADLRDLVRQATLAASSHNTQPWRFRLGERSITILSPASSPFAILEHFWSVRPRNSRAIESTNPVSASVGDITHSGSVPSPRIAR